ncbi:hypothetical protein [Paenibacillus rigui]|uniref:Uncharacterized protein n=1 Tax=Paenibacillus rigui TaxID=554312 RepID=A0A229UTR1_9BACL|nr:hypothetical protein [Paenibacillus rigui]OXM86782.1 hypothetical protein CF651_07995 [Paenibacillus rigui]
MRTKLKKAAAAALITSMLMSFNCSAVLADDMQEVTIDNRYPATLNGPLQVKVNGFLSEHTLSGTRIGIQVKMYNISNDTVRVPDYEVRILTENGAKYVLKGSADNAVSVPPLSNINLSYLAQIDLPVNLKPTDLVWIDVNKDVYPKQETTLLDLPVSNLVWYGDNSAITDASAVKAWGETFTIPSVDSALTYTPVSLTTDFKDQTPVQLIKLLVQNPGAKSEPIPPIVLNGKSASQIYKGSRSDQSVTNLDPGEKKYIYYSIPTDLDTQLSSFTLSTVETYVTPNRADVSAAVSYAIGRLSIGLPTAEQASNDSTKPIAYTMNTTLPIDPINNVVNPNISVSVVDLQLYENKGMGYQTGIAKLKFSNQSDKPLPVPQFAAELVGSGFSYAGTRNNATSTLIVPGTDYVVTYSFVLPLKDAKEQYVLRLIDQKTAAPYKVTFSQAIVNVSHPAQDPLKAALYPYELSIHDWALSTLAGLSQATQSYAYSYKLSINMDLVSNIPVMVDSKFNKLLMELNNANGRTIATTTLDLNGDNRLTTGQQLIYFKDTQSDQLEYPLTLNLYEVIDTPNGPARRLVSTLQQGK